MEMQLSGNHGCWVCDITIIHCVKDFFTAGSFAWEDVNYHRDGFRAPLLLSLSHNKVSIQEELFFIIN